MGNIECFESSTSDKNIKNPIQTSLKISKPKDPPSFQQNSQNNPNNQEQCQAIGKKTTLTIDDFYVIKQLGSGAFGQVFLVNYQKKNKQLAMKIMKKQDILKNQLLTNITLEKIILEKNKNPFLVSLKYAFQTNSKLYLVMEYLQGGDLYHLMRKKKIFSEFDAQFYIAEILCGIQYLHEELNVIYRDLKPENVLLSQSGHVKLTDFGLSKETKYGKTYTFAGTPEYLAPEIIKNIGHTKSVDFWSLGVLLFEMVAGESPFTDQNRNFNGIEKKILENNPVYPKTISQSCLDLLKKLLVSDPQYRLGTTNIQDIFNHPFFGKLDWKLVKQCKMPSPFQNIIPYNVKQSRQPGKIVESQDDQNLPHFAGITYVGNDMDNTRISTIQQFNQKK